MILVVDEVWSNFLRNLAAGFCFWSMFASSQAHKDDNNWPTE